MKKKAAAGKKTSKPVRKSGGLKLKKLVAKATKSAHKLMAKKVIPASNRVKSSISAGLQKLKLDPSMTDAQIRRMPNSAYMNDIQLGFFRVRLLQQRQEVLSRQTEVKDRLNQHENFADPADRASAEEEHWLDLRLRERESMLLRKIDEALRRISEREFGYCKVTGEPIGIPRLLARPTAEVCVDVKGQNEHVEAQFRDR
ncbi:MAG: RNA polymerase-binding protein DksA [Pseudomonadota bacterium]